MEPFVTLTAVAAPIDMTNVDTDRIIPARFLTHPRASGIGKYAFYDLRFDGSGAPRPEFPLNQDGFRGARILVADDNFGCGSSREAAVWTLVDLHDGAGIRAVIAPRFGDIFYSNACKNGLLPIELPAGTVAQMRRQLAENPGATIAIDLPAQTVIGPDGASHPFDIDPFRKECLIKGIDEISLTLEHAAAIEAYEAARRRDVPWSVPRAPG